MIQRLSIVAVLFISLIPTAYAQSSIDNPRVVIHPQKHTIQIKWYQEATARIVVFKITNTRDSTQRQCSLVDWSEYLQKYYGMQYCYEIYNQYNPRGDITVVDKHWKKRTKYFILQFMYTSHNAPYGPFE